MAKLRDSRRLPTFQVERAIFERADLSSNEKLMLCYLAMRANAEDRCWPSYATVARDCGFSRRTAINVVRHLEQKGLVSRTLRKSDQGEYTSNLFRLFSAEEQVFVPEVGSAASAPPPGAGGAPPSEMTAPRVVQEVHLKTTQIEDVSTNHEVEVEFEAEKVVARAIARGIDIGNRHAYKKGVIKNILAERDQQTRAERVTLERKAQRENCAACDATGMINSPLHENTMMFCPTCSVSTLKEQSAMGGPA